MVIWIFGLSGSGKSTLSSELAKRYKEKYSRLPVILDGDVLRGAYPDVLGHSSGERLEASRRMAKFAKCFHDQGHLVICSLVCLYPTARHWIKNHISDNLFVFVDAPLQTLIKRDPKGLYKQKESGLIDNVAGVDLPFPKPEKQDIRIQNKGNLPSFVAKSKSIIELL